MARIVAVLDTMWGAPGRAPRFFKINPLNRSGQRLYKLVGTNVLYVTNVCREQVGHARHHGKPDPTWLKENLGLAKADLILVCGNVAQRCFKESGYTSDSKVLRIAHPAARNWTKSRLNRTIRKIRRLCGT